MSLEGLYEVGKTIQSEQPEEGKRLHEYRMRLEPYIFHHLMETQWHMVDTFWQSYVPPKRAKYAFLIIERRDHPNFPFVLRNIAWANPTMSVHIVCSDTNRDFLHAILGNKVEHYTIVEHFRGSPSAEQAKQEYNALLKDWRLYESIDAEYAITVQMDTIFRKKIPDSIFVGDYWGSPWAWRQDLPGGGGATIRNIHSLRSLCLLYNPTPNTSTDLDAEDGWLSVRVQELGMVYPSLSFRKSHIMESMPAEDPMILHQFWTFLDQYLSQPKENVLKYWKHLLTLQ